MTRGLDAATATAAASANPYPIVLVKLEFDSGDVRLHSRLGDFVYNGETYTGAGDLGQIGSIDEDFDLMRAPLTIGLRGLTNDIIAITLTEKYQGRPATIYLGYLDPTTLLLVGEPAVFTGQMDYPTTSLGKECAIALRIEDEFATLDQAKIRRYNNADQQSEYPGDRAFEFAEQAVSKTIYWGQKTPVQPK